MEDLGVFSTMSTIYRMCSILTKFEYKNNNERKPKNKEMKNLEP
jgi:hypothetical protein